MSISLMVIRFNLYIFLFPIVLKPIAYNGLQINEVAEGNLGRGTAKAKPFIRCYVPRADRRECNVARRATAWRKSGEGHPFIS